MEDIVKYNSNIVEEILDENKMQNILKKEKVNLKCMNWYLKPPKDRNFKIDIYIYFFFCYTYYKEIHRSEKCQIPNLGFYILKKKISLF